MAAFTLSTEIIISPRMADPALPTTVHQVVVVRSPAPPRGHKLIRYAGGVCLAAILCWIIGGYLGKLVILAVDDSIDSPLTFFNPWNGEQMWGAFITLLIALAASLVHYNFCVSRSS